MTATARLWVEPLPVTTHELVPTRVPCPRGCFNRWTRRRNRMFQYQHGFWLVCFMCHFAYDRCPPAWRAKNFGRNT